MVNIIFKTISSLEKVLKNQKEVKNFNFASCLKNEIFNFQIVLKTDKNIDNLCLIINNINTNCFTLNKIIYKHGKLAPNTHNADDYFITKETCEFPEILFVTDGRFDLIADEWSLFWVSIDTQKLESSGLKKIEINLLSENECLLQQVFELEIIDCELNKNHDMIITNWLHIDCICEWYNLQPFNKKFYNIFEIYLNNYIQHGNNMLLIPIFTPPLDTQVGGERMTVQLIDVKITKGRYSFNFDKFKQFIEFISSRGVKYFELSHLFTQWGAEFCPKICAEVDGETKKIFGWEDKSTGRRYRYFLSKFLKALNEVLLKLGIKDKCFMHISDEPSAKNIRRYLSHKHFIKKYIKGIKIIDALSSYRFCEEKIVDLPFVALKKTDEYINNNAKFAVYYCCVEHTKYVSNRYLNMPSQRNRILGYQMYLNNSKGFLHWGYNFYNWQFSISKIDPYEINNAGGSFSSGDCFVVYPVENGLLNSLRHKVFFDAIQDYMALKTLEVFIGQEEVKKILITEGLSGYTVYPRSDVWHLKFREKINKLIKKLSKG